MERSTTGNSGIELDLIQLPDIPELKPDTLSDLYGNRGSEQSLSNIIDKLDKKMKSGSFLYTFTGQIEEINRMIRMKYASTRDIASVILKDVALSSRVLSIVNSSYYGYFGQKGVSSISDAMVILGTEEVQQTASTLLLFEFMQDIAEGELLREKSLASLMRGMMARDIAEGSKYSNRDEFQLVAMLYDIGEQIVLFCDPELYKRIVNFSKSRGMDMERASQKLLGASFGRIGQGIVSRWGFPDQVINAMKPFRNFSMDRDRLSQEDIKRLVASFTSEMCSIEWHISDAQRSDKIGAIVEKYEHLLDLGFSRVEGLFESSMKKIENHARVFKIDLKNSRFHRNPDPIKNEQNGYSPALQTSFTLDDRRVDGSVFTLDGRRVDGSVFTLDGRRVDGSVSLESGIGMGLGQGDIAGHIPGAGEPGTIPSGVSGSWEPGNIAAAAVKGGGYSREQGSPDPGGGTDPGAGIEYFDQARIGWIRGRIFHIEDIISRPYKLSEVLHTIITTIYKGFFFSRISICIVNQQNRVIAPRFVLGDDLSDFGKKLKFSIEEESPDIFNKALGSGVDMIVENIDDKDSSFRVPDWYRRTGLSKAFSIYPIVIKKKKVGMIYVDWDQKFTTLFSNDVKQFMHQLKVITVMAIKKSRGSK
ncbi:MAG: HDOD domain-containing protein [Desulfamplus sp.]|nr:HDOD domain-containing protein [Desulfamplus sp.]